MNKSTNFLNKPIRRLINILFYLQDEKSLEIKKNYINQAKKVYEKHNPVFIDVDNTQQFNSSLDYYVSEQSDFINCIISIDISKFELQDAIKVIDIIVDINDKYNNIYGEYFVFQFSFTIENKEELKTNKQYKMIADAINQSEMFRGVLDSLHEVDTNLEPENYLEQQNNVEIILPKPKRYNKKRLEQANHQIKLLNKNLNNLFKLVDSIYIIYSKSNTDFMFPPLMDLNSEINSKDYTMEYENKKLPDEMIDKLNHTFNDFLNKILIINNKIV